MSGSSRKTDAGWLQWCQFGRDGRASAPNLGCFADAVGKRVCAASLSIGANLVSLPSSTLHHVAATVAKAARPDTTWRSIWRRCLSSGPYSVPIKGAVSTSLTAPGHPSQNTERAIVEQKANHFETRSMTFHFVKLERANHVSELGLFRGLKGRDAADCCCSYRVGGSLRASSPLLELQHLCLSPCPNQSEDAGFRPGQFGSPCRRKRLHPSRATFRTALSAMLSVFSTRAFLPCDSS